MQNLGFHILLPANHYTNVNSMHLCFPIKILKLTDPTQNIRADLITVNNFFAHWIKELKIQKYGNDIHILPMNNPLKLYRYSEAILKHLPKDLLKTFGKTMLYSKKKVLYNETSTDSQTITQT